VLIDLPKAKSSFRKLIVLIGVSACLCTTVNAQGPSDGEVNDKANELANKAFVQRFKEQPTSGYVGPVSTGKLLCLDVVRVAPNVCQAVIEYRNPTFSPIPKARTPADVENKTWNWTVIANFQIFRVRHIADGTWGAWTEWQNRDRSQEATYEVIKLRYSNQNWTWEPGDDITRFIQGWSIDSSQNLVLADLMSPAMHRAPTALDSIHCHDSLNHRVPVRQVSREDAFRWCGITPQQWDELKNSGWKSLPAAQQTRPQPSSVPLANRPVAPPPPARGSAGNSVIKITPVEATVSSKGIQLRVLPKAENGVAFTVPANAAVIIDAKSPDGWFHVIAKQSKDHWTPTPPFYGWAPPGSFPETQSH
jgi:hypothetical protein